MKRGMCKMCLQEKQLIESHLIPRAVYDLCRTADSEPVRISSTVIMQTSRQTKTHLLCSECDNHLNKYGETWLLPKLKTWDKGFPLYDILTKIPPDVAEGEGAAYAASRNPEIDVAAISHFAIGVFWKASVHSWQRDTKEPRIELGPYGELLRLFLRHEGYFPSHAVLNVGIVPPAALFSNAMEPYRGSATGPRNYVFNVPGLQFVLTVGKTIDTTARQTCFHSSALHPIILTDLSRPMYELYRSQTRKAHRSKKLIEYLAKKKANGVLK